MLQFSHDPEHNGRNVKYEVAEAAKTESWWIWALEEEYHMLVCLIHTAVPQHFSQLHCLWSAFALQMDVCSSEPGAESTQQAKQD